MDGKEKKKNSMEMDARELFKFSPYDDFGIINYIINKIIDSDFLLENGKYSYYDEDNKRIILLTRGQLAYKLWEEEIKGKLDKRYKLIE